MSMVRRGFVLGIMAVTASAYAGAADEASKSAALVGDASNGKALFSQTCQNCHATEIGVNKIGPSLWGVVGKMPASVPDYAYSQAMRANKTPWTAVALDAYLADPRGDLHGVKMYFKGFPERQDRADVIAYLKSLD